MTVGRGAARRRRRRLARALHPAHGRCQIPRGENAGHTLPYKHVVREMVLLGKWRGEAATFPVPGGSPDLAEAVLVQANEAGPILAAAKR